MIMNVEQSSFSGVVLNVSRLVGIKEIIGSKMFGKSRFNNTIRIKYKIISLGKGKRGFV